MHRTGTFDLQGSFSSFHTAGRELPYCVSWPFQVRSQQNVGRGQGQVTLLSGIEAQNLIPSFPRKGAVSCLRSGFDSVLLLYDPRVLSLSCFVGNHQYTHYGFTALSRNGRLTQVESETLIAFLLQNFHWFCVLSRPWEPPSRIQCKLISHWSTGVILSYPSAW